MAYTVKEVSEKTGISAYTLRFYEKEGVLPPIERDMNGMRIFDDSIIDWIESVLALRSTGLSLSEIRKYLELYQDKNTTLEERKEILSLQKSKVEEQISLLMKALERLNYKLALIDIQQNRFDKLP
ncbi:MULTISPECIES: MerR family transcriptional regulator [Paenibacillus]|uniref:MerR family transcriptional regulator n=1 Tax=Paenibacillus TaxID=44249 RepID=UPI0004283990|nr:MerR family transcriptional regulator [Paenibacillus massiliensis]